MHHIISCGKVLCLHSIKLNDSTVGGRACADICSPRRRVFLMLAASLEQLPGTRSSSARYLKKCYDIVRAVGALLLITTSSTNELSKLTVACHAETKHFRSTCFGQALSCQNYSAASRSCDSRLAPALCWVMGRGVSYTSVINRLFSSKRAAMLLALLLTVLSAAGVGSEVTPRRSSVFLPPWRVAAACVALSSPSPCLPFSPY